ncbi:MAG: glutaredoxin 3 [Congregibacter sp.]
MNPPVTLYTTRFCPYCMAARQLLKAKGLDYEDVPVDGDPELREQMSQRAGQHTVPQIWIGDKHVGGYTELAALENSGQLDRLVGPN